LPAQQRSAEEYFERAKARYDRSDYEGALADLNQVLRLRADLADAYRMRGNARQALAAPDALCLADYDRAIELDPHNGLAYFDRAWQLMWRLNGDREAAFADLQKSAELGYQVHINVRLMGKLKRHVGDLEGALADLDKALELKQDSYHNHNRGLIRLGLGDIEGAIEDLSADLAFPMTCLSESYLYRGYALLLKGDAAAAEADFEAYLKKVPQGKAVVDSRKALARLLSSSMPETAAEFINRSQALVNLGFHEEARFDLTRALALEPDNAEAYYRRAGLRRIDKYLTSAIQDCDEAIKRLPNHPDAYVRRAACWSDRGDHEKALADAQRALEIEDRHADALDWMGYEYLQLKEYDKALAAYTRASEVNPSYYWYHYRRGEVLFNQGRDLTAALAALNKAVELSTKAAESNVDAQGFLLRGRIWLAKNDLDEAIPDLTKAVELSPYWAEAYFRRAEALIAKKELAGAASDLAKAIEYDKFNVEYYLQRARIRSELGDATGAMADAEKALLWDADSPEAYLVRGLLHHWAGQTAEAEADFALCLKLKPELKERLDAELAAKPPATATTTKPSTTTDTTTPSTRPAATPAAPAASPVVSAAVQKIIDSGKELYAKGDLDAAAKEFSRAVVLAPTRVAEAYLYRGLVFLRQGKQAEAERDFGRCLRINPELKARLDEESQKVQGAPKQ
jgi:tetratricopeptide (TPR) repeat protein